MMGAPGVIVTAGGAGIGLAIAEVFAERGARVAICDTSAAAIESALADRPGMMGREADVADPAAVAAFVRWAEAELGSIDVLVNNAGIAGPVGQLDELDPDAWARCFAVNVQGAFHAMREVVPAMRRRRSGSIINISTASTTTGTPGRSAYVASKWALEGLTRNAARELGPSGIRVNAIRPGFMDTPRMAGIMARIAAERGLPVAEVEAEALEFISMRAKVQPREIGEMAAFLASDAAAHVTGQIIGVCGNAEWEG